MAVEEQRHILVRVLQQGQAGGELVDEEGARPEGGELAREGDGEEEVPLAQDGAEDGQAGEEGRGDEPGAADADVEGSWAG